MNELRQVLTDNAARFCGESEEAFVFENEIERCRALGVSVLTPDSQAYPALLASIPDAPKVLYVRGVLSEARTLAIVGSRNPTPYGRRIARRLSREAAEYGMVTVSGLARGIDTEAHRATLDAGGVTWAVLGSGLERPYPAENSALMQEIVDRGGAVISEVPLSGPPSPGNFPRRNRIISGLSWGSVVVEGNVKSGALITARCALDQGREVFAVPGPVDSEMSEGPHELLKKGAWLIAGLADVLDELPFLSNPSPSPLRGKVLKEAPATTAEEQKVLKLMGSEAIPLENLIQETGWDVEFLACILMELEVKGLVNSCSGQRYAKQ